MFLICCSNRSDLVSNRILWKILEKRKNILVIFQVDHNVVEESDSGLIGLVRFRFREVKWDFSFFYFVEFFHDFLKVISGDSYKFPVSHPLILSYKSIFIKIHFSHEDIIWGLTVTGEVFLDSLSINDFLLRWWCYFMEYFECFLEGSLFKLFYKRKVLMIGFGNSFPFFWSWVIKLIRLKY